MFGFCLWAYIISRRVSDALAYWALLRNNRDGRVNLGGNGTKDPCCLLKRHKIGWGRQVKWRAAGGGLVY